jgi:hypothetical protein
MLFHGNNAHLTKCSTFEEAQYDPHMLTGKVPRKSIRWFPIILRLLHMYRCTDLAELMVWHKKHRSKPGVMRLPVDSPAHKHVESTLTEFLDLLCKSHCSSRWMWTHTVKDICHQLSAISLANFKAIYFSQSCRAMLLSSLSPRPRGVVTCCHICAIVPFYSRWETRGCVYNLWSGWWPRIMYYSFFLCKLPLRHVVLYYCTMFIVSFSTYSAPLCNFIFKNRSNVMCILLIFSLGLPRKNKL